MIDSPSRALAPITFVLGGARSGKSAFAETLANTADQPVYLATASADDNEMTERIRQHRVRRGPHWQTIEEPLDLTGTIAQHSAPANCILIDCLTLWLANLMQADRDIARASDCLLSGLRKAPGAVILVSNEVGLGIVPDNRLARDFRDHAGRLHQSVAGIAQRAYFIVAGLPITLKDTIGER